MTKDMVMTTTEFLEKFNTKLQVSSVGGGTITLKADWILVTYHRPYEYLHLLHRKSSNNDCGSEDYILKYRYTLDILDFYRENDHLYSVSINDINTEEDYFQQSLLQDLNSITLEDINFIKYFLNEIQTRC